MREDGLMRIFLIYREVKIKNSLEWRNFLSHYQVRGKSSSTKAREKLKLMVLTSLRFMRGCGA